MFEAVSTWHCSHCDTQLSGKDEECPFCWQSIQIAELRAVVKSLLPYVRLYSPPEDAEDFDSEVKKQERIGRRAERVLKGVPIKWDDSKSRWVKR